MPDLQPNTCVFRGKDISEEAYNETYENYDMEVCGLHREVHVRYSDKLGQQDELDDEESDAKLVVVTEDPACPSFVRQQGNDTEVRGRQWGHHASYS